MPEVPGGAAVDVVVALAFLLFVLSVVSAAVAELIANATNLEASPPGMPG